MSSEHKVYLSVTWILLSEVILFYACAAAAEFFLLATQLRGT